MDKILQICQHAQELFLELGCRLATIKTQQVLQYKGRFYKVTYVKGLDGIVIESASSLEEAEANCFEDDDVYPLAWGEDKILSTMQEDLKKFYLNE